LLLDSSLLKYVKGQLFMLRIMSFRILQYFQNNQIEMVSKYEHPCLFIHPHPSPPAPLSSITL